jgi:regulator of replication initiation timing
LKFVFHATCHNFSFSFSQPIFATVDAVADFADQFTRLESENVQLRKAIKTSVDQVLVANRLTAEAQNENTLLKDELKKLKKKMKDEQEARCEATIAANEKEGALRESISSLLRKFLFTRCTVFF